MGSTRPLEMSAVANPTIAALSGLRQCKNLERKQTAKIIKRDERIIFVFFMEFIEAVQETARRAGYHLSVNHQ